jgi:hypothetical protein
MVTSEARVRRVRFYVQIQRTLWSLGLIAIEQRFVGHDEVGLSPERARKETFSLRTRKRHI